MLNIARFASFGEKVAQCSISPDVMNRYSKIANIHPYTPFRQR